jgi:hypothetical protein
MLQILMNLNGKWMLLYLYKHKDMADFNLSKLLSIWYTMSATEVESLRYKIRYQSFYQLRTSEEHNVDIYSIIFV